MPFQTSPPVSATEIREIVGDIDDATVAAIIKTGATAAEVTEGFMWAIADDALGTELDHARRGAAGQVYEILRSEEEPEDR